jgi:ribonuclease HII
MVATTEIAGRRVRLLVKRPRGMALDSPNLFDEILRLEQMAKPVLELRQTSANEKVLVAGCDEVGAGCLAGPVVAAAVAFAPGVPLFEALNDSKVVPRERREDICASLQNCEDVFIGIGVVDAETVDLINVREARLLAMRRAVDSLCERTKPTHLLVDGNVVIGGDRIPIERQQCIVGGDAVCDAIAAGSIVAKVTRDAMMRLAHEEYPEFGFDTNAGYGTKIHMQALGKFGPTPLHRRSYAPVQRALSRQEMS